MKNLKGIPRGLVDMLKIPGLGAKRIKVIYDSTGISSIAELKEAANAHKLRNYQVLRKTELSILKE